MANSGNIIAATLAESGGAFYLLPLGTPLPTSATEELDAAAIDMGWCGPEGFKNSAKRSTTKHYAFGGENVKTTQDRYEETFSLELLETSAKVARLIYGEDAVTEGASDGEFSVEHSPLMLERASFVIDVVDGDRVGRHVIREGQVTEVADIENRHDQMTKYGPTIDTYRPEGAKAAVVTYWGKAGSAPAVAAKSTKPAPAPAV